MKKVYFLFLLCCSSLVALSQGTTTVTIFATGAAGTAITASSTTTVRTEGNIVTNSATERGYAVFDLSTLPAGVSITACTLGIDVTGLAGGGAVGGWSTQGVAGSLAGVTTPATLYADMDGGTVVSTASYGAAAGENTVAFTAAGNTFMTAQVGTLVSICLTGGNRTYTITGETGTATTTGVHAPYLSITYCTPPSAVTATATPTALCIGNTLTLTGAATGATSFAWAGPGGFAAAVESTTSVVTAASTGIYTLTATNTCGTVTSSTIATTASVTANTVPADIAGGVNVCTGHTLTLTDATTGGTWSISPAGVATLSATGTLTGVAAGSAVVTYSLGTGCTDTTTINDFTPPAAITGGATVICTGSTLALNETTTGGTWTSANTAVATVDATGVVTAVSGGSSVISYTLPSGCFSSLNLIINPATAPDPITGVTTECVGSNVTLSDASGGGNWSSSEPGTAQIYPTGVTYGINAGVATITYTSAATGCFVTSTMTVVAAPAAITGTAGACVGSNTTLTETTTGGVWSSANTNIATVDSVSGAVTGVALGSVTISYTVPPGCSSTDNITVQPLPSAIAGSAVVCTGSTTTLTNTTVGGGTWSSSNTAVVTVGLTTGIVSGVSADAATITFTTAAGCTTTQVINDADPPVAITGDTAAICAGNPLTLNDATTGGTWTSGNTAVATNAGAVITSVAAGSSIISYTLANTCFATAIVTVDPLPVAIAGNGIVCTGSTITLTDATSGGKWSSSATTIATIDSVAGTVTGILDGAATITYTVGTGCFATFAIIDADTPASITGGGVLVCAGTPLTLGETTTGGTWTSSNVVIATVDPATGAATGASSGVDTVIYTLTSGCFAEAAITVNPLPEVINGGTLICTGSMITLTDTATGGTWSSSVTTVATIDSTAGTVTGVTAGTSTVTYTLSTGCSITSTITDSDPPGAITTTVTEICQAGTTTYTNTTGGGTWSSSNTAVATIDSNAGTITGTGGGTATISYIMPSSCVVTAVVSVDPLPAAIAGSAFVCTGSTTLLTDATSGGTWSSSDPTTDSIDVTGNVYGLLAGAATISYTLATSCAVTLTVTDNDPPGAIGGTAVVCVLSTTQLSNGLAGGSWSSTDMGVATVDNTGLVTGVGAGVATISYIMPTTCFITVQVTVNPIPAAIQGATSICTGGTTLLTTLNTDGGWSTSNPGAASIDASGTVYGIAAGTATISYTITATGCFVTSLMTDNDPPGGVTGPGTVCQLASVNLTETSGGGTWVSSEPAIATVDGTGAVTGVNAGTVTISYILSSGCFSTEVMTVNPIPAAITGATAVCTGGTALVADANTDGTWSTSAAGTASVDATTGTVSGMSGGYGNYFLYSNSNRLLCYCTHAG